MNPEQYNNCVDSFADAIYRFAIKTLKNNVLAEDIVQDAFEKLWVNREKVDFTKAKSFLFTLAYRQMIDMIRHVKVQNDHKNELFTNTQNDHQYTDLNEMLHQAVEKLPPDQRSVLLLCDYEGYSYKEISEITNLSESQVRVYIHRARLSMRQYIKRIEYLI